MSMKQSLIRIKFAEKELLRYREDVGDWNEQHDELASDCWIWEDLVAKANFLFERLTCLFADIAKFALECDQQLAEVMRARNLRNLAVWQEVSVRLLAQAMVAERGCGSVEGVELLRANNGKATEKLNSPRPVRIDENGRIFEMSGEQIILSGLAPEEVLKSLEDERCGRTRPLREIIAARVGNGI
jgi:hypothetical protein